jgi:hypothetical protein
MKRLLLAVLALVAASAAQAAEPASIGAIKSVSGDARIVRAGQEVKAEPGAALRQADVLRTGDDGALGVTFRDNSTVSLGPNSDLALEAFVFEPAQSKFGFVGRMARGTAFFVSGAMAKLAPESVSVVTPTSTIGVRGTRFLVEVDERG